ncbi:hypothetical protein CsSME_00044642 [Camellia sinensis var. sinensis]
MILDKGQLLETEQMFRDAGEKRPVIIPEEEIRQAALGTKERLRGSGDDIVAARMGAKLNVAGWISKQIEHDNAACESLY